MSATSCPSCGGPVRAGLAFCPTCGVRVGESPSTPPTPPAPESQPPVQQQPVVIQGFQPAGTAYPSAPPTQPLESTQPAPVQQYVPPAYQPPADTRRNETRRMVLAGAMALIAVLVVRVVMAANAEPEGELVAQLPVGPEGGSAEFSDGGKINVPKGALTKRETITVRRAVMPRQIRAVSPFDNSPLVIPPGTVFVYILGPTDIVLQLPVTLILPVPASNTQGLVFVSANGQVTFVPGAQRGRTMTVRLNSFDFSRGPQVFVNQGP